MLNLLPLLLAKAGAATITTKVVVAGAVSVAALGTAGATGVVPVEELLPGEATSVTVPDERPGQDALDGVFDRAGEVAAEEAQKALEDAQEAAEDAQKAAQKIAEDAQKAAEDARQTAAEKSEQAPAPVEAAPEQAEQRDAPSSGDVVADQPEVGAGDSGARGRN
jgi:ElaB/YqjD/DUF883 family membrane-anchored ribosome-binding protein